MKTCTQIKKNNKGIQVHKHKNTSMFFMCVSEFQNMKNEIPKPHHGNKSPQTQKTLSTMN
jgi:hypothetical protein